MAVTRLIDLALLRQGRAETRPGQAAGAALSSAARGGALWVAATAILAARVATGRHFPTDVIVAVAVGAATGAAIHALGRRRDPVAPRDP
jgi:hypothetical protein